jgi:hypothetical protein
MDAGELAFLEDRLESAELLDCASCGEETLHVHEQVVSIGNGVTELLMRCGECLSCRPWLLIE